MQNQVEQQRRKIDPMKERLVSRFERAMERLLPVLSEEEKNRFVTECIAMIKPELRTKPLLVMDLDSLLEPQVKSPYMEITFKTWVYLQQKACELLTAFDKAKEKGGDDLSNHETVEHWANIRNGIPPYGMRIVGN